MENPLVKILDKIIYFIRKLKEGVIYCIKPNQKNVDKMS